jgi:nitrous oxidase accessory protein NosD
MIPKSKIYVIILCIMFIAGGLTIFLSVQTCKATSENILYVGGSGPGNYSSIQSAINASSNGSTIYVYSGTYLESISINKSINLMGENTNTTVIEGFQSFIVVEIPLNGVSIQGFTIKGGQYMIGDTSNIGIQILSNNNIVNNNNIQNLDIGIKIINSSSNNSIYHNNFFINNTESAYDEGINIWDNGYPSGGNYWNNNVGVDANHDGIVDTAYNITGGNNQDRYPLIEPYVKSPVTQKQTPGFEIIISIVAISLILFWKRKN